MLSIKYKKEKLSELSKQNSTDGNLPKKPFTEDDVLLLWDNYAKKMSSEGKRLMETLLRINKPVVKENTLYVELPNHSAKGEFLQNYNELIGYLRGNLQNHDVSISITVNENISSTKAYTPEEKLERLKKINPALEELKKLFQLDL